MHIFGSSNKKKTVNLMSFKRNIKQINKRFRVGAQECSGEYFTYFTDKLKDIFQEEIKYKRFYSKVNPIETIFFFKFVYE